MFRDGTCAAKGDTVSNMVTKVQRGVDVVFEAPRWSERWVLEDDITMPEGPEHQNAAALLERILVAWIARVTRDASAHINLAVRWDQSHPKVGVDPDVCLIEPALRKGEKSLRTWVDGHHAPRVVVEVVSENSGEKDYVDGPQRYAASGARELWIFDPERFGSANVGGPWVLQVWRRTKAGAFRQDYAGDGPAYSDELGAWLVITDDGTRLRIADDEAGEHLWPTGMETERARADAERARADAERARADAERTRADAERARADALAAQLAARR
jgi:Uma2 family endonuclease